MTDVRMATDASFAREVEQHDGLTLVQFTAAWCGPCRFMTPVVDGIAADYAGRLRAVRVDVDDSPATAARFNIRSVPTTLVFQGGTEVARIVGAQPRPALEARLQQHLA